MLPSEVQEHLIFDRYPPDSTKSVTRSNRAGKNASRKHLLRLHTPLPAQKIDLSVTHNRIQLISLISQYLVEHSLEYDNELVLNSEDPNPVAMKNGEVTKRVDLHNTHEEADLIIVNQLMNVAENGASNICVVCDDTDVFVLLYALLLQRETIDCNVSMESPIAGRSVIDIKATANKHRDIADNLPELHALTGCDTNSYIHTIWNRENICSEGTHSWKIFELVG